MKESSSFSSLQELYSQKNDLIGRFVALQNEIFNVPRDYGGDTILTKVLENDIKAGMRRKAKEGVT